ncbi:hypothetical protein [Kitasatospora cineracea]|uniref:hypothetical protein n=1 Tax=Kitasatospora cineracea TaxID=88074 RepID=UPI0037F711A9
MPYRSAQFDGNGPADALRRTTDRTEQTEARPGEGPDIMDIQPTCNDTDADPVPSPELPRSEKDPDGTPPPWRPESKAQ